MSNSRVCHNCGSTDIEEDVARGDAVCTGCGSVLEENVIVSEMQFAETGMGGHSAIGQFVGEGGQARVNFGGMQGVNNRESREITHSKGRERIIGMASQLRLNQHCIDTAFNFFKLAVAAGLTRGRPSANVVAACLYLTCRLEGTPHLLLDFSDVLQVNVYELGRTYSFLARKLHIRPPPTDPCVHVMRFAHNLSLGDKEHEVGMMALRLVQRMKRDWMGIGRRPTGLCGAALVLACRFYNFNRTLVDVVNIVQIGESAIRKRLVEFASTPSSKLTLDEFQSVDLETEADPPAFSESKRRGKHPVHKPDAVSSQSLDAMTHELCSKADQMDTILEFVSQTPKKIKMTPKRVEKILEAKRRLMEAGKDGPVALDPDLFPGLDKNIMKTRHSSVLANLCGGKESIIGDDDYRDELGELGEKFLEDEVIGPILSDDELVRGAPNGDSCGGEVAEELTPAQKLSHHMPTLENLGILKFDGLSKLPDTLVKKPGGECGKDEELDLEGIDDEEIGRYLLNERESKLKGYIWHAVNGSFLEKMEQKRKMKEEEETKRMEEGGFKRRRPKKRKAAGDAPLPGSAAEAIQMVVKERKLSNKINYEVLKNLAAVPSGPGIAKLEEKKVEASDFTKSDFKTKMVASTAGIHSAPFGSTEVHVHSDSGEHSLLLRSSDFLEKKLNASTFGNFPSTSRFGLSRFGGGRTT